MLYHKAQCFRLGFGIVFRMAGWGLALGALAGGLTGGLVFGLANPIYSTLAALVGAVTGGISGLLLGLAIGGTLVLFSVRGMPTDIKGYLRLARATSIFWIIVGTIVIAFLLKIQAHDIPVYLISITIAGLIAAGAAWWACGKVVAWVQQELP